MKSTIETTSKYTIVLDDKEAEYVRSLLNAEPIVLNEPHEISKIRTDLQNAVRKVEPGKTP